MNRLTFLLLAGFDNKPPTSNNQFNAVKEFFEGI